VRTVSADFLEDLYKESTEIVVHELVTIQHDDLPTPIRLCNNTEKVESRGNDYLPFPFLARIPSTVENEVPKIQIVFDNVSQELLEEIRSITTPPTIDLEVVSSRDANTVEAGPWSFTMKGAQYDQNIIEIELSYEDYLQEPFPFERFTPINFPGLFKRVGD
jgi:hypothetical protein